MRHTVPFKKLVYCIACFALGFAPLLAALQITQFLVSTLLHAFAGHVMFVQQFKKRHTRWRSARVNRGTDANRDSDDVSCDAFAGIG